MTLCAQGWREKRGALDAVSERRCALRSERLSSHHHLRHQRQYCGPDDLHPQHPELLPCKDRPIAPHPIPSLSTNQTSSTTPIVPVRHVICHACSPSPSVGALGHATKRRRTQCHLRGKQSMAATAPMKQRSHGHWPLQNRGHARCSDSCLLRPRRALAATVAGPRLGWRVPTSATTRRLLTTKPSGQRRLYCGDIVLEESVDLPALLSPQVRPRVPDPCWPPCFKPPNAAKQEQTPRIRTAWTAAAHPCMH